jgi:hypothetical protein
MIRTGQLNRHSKWYVFVNGQPLLDDPHDNEFQAEGMALMMYPGQTIITTTEPEHPVHQEGYSYDHEQKEAA